MRRSSQWATLAVVLLAAAPALAVQPLEVFVAGARDKNPDTLSARATLETQRAQADVAFGRVLPGITLRGVYTRNQYETKFSTPAAGGASANTITITPANQLDAFGILTVPLIDLANFKRVAAARTGADAAARSLEATLLSVEGAAVQGYYQLVANMALLAASQQALTVSQEGLRIAQARFNAGSAAALDVDRARADVEQNVQQVAATELQVALSARALESVSGVTPDTSTAVVLADDLHPEPALATFEGDLAKLPSVSAAQLSTRAAEKQADAQRLTLVPSLAGSFTEHGSNTSGFSGHDWTYQAVVALTWTLDFTTSPGIRLQEAAASSARANEQRVRLAARDAIHREWQTVAADIARGRSARVGQEAAAHAAQLAHDRYQAGTTTQLELLQAQRDAFAAEVTRIQADADLANAREQLRLSSGQSRIAAAPGR